MFEKLVKMYIKPNCVLYFGVAIGLAMGMFWIGTVRSGFPPYEPFEFTPAIFFLTVAALVWTRILYNIMNRSFQAPDSSLMMTLPVSEETLVQSKVFVGTLGGTVLALIAGLIMLYWGYLGDGYTIGLEGIAVQLTGIASMYVDLTYPSWVAAVSIGLIPILVILEQCFFSVLLLAAALLMHGSAGLQKCTGAVYLLLMILQIGFILWLFVNYPVFIGRVHPLVIAGALAAIFGGGAALLERLCINRLKHHFNV